jgi:transposase
MMLKVLVHAYSQRIFPSRQITKALRENVDFMWRAPTTGRTFARSIDFAAR